jgi:hypothetical protein
MPKTTIDILVDEFAEKLRKAGVPNYLLMVSDPDSNNEIMRCEGSPFWRIGAAQTAAKDAENDIEGEDRD